MTQFDRRHFLGSGLFAAAAATIITDVMTTAGSLALRAVCCSTTRRRFTVATVSPASAAAHGTAGVGPASRLGT